jgi:hypothetical protein
LAAVVNTPAAEADGARGEAAHLFDGQPPTKEITMMSRVDEEKAAEVLHAQDLFSAACDGNSFIINEWDRDVMCRMANALGAAKEFFAEKFPTIMTGAKLLAAARALSTLFDEELVASCGPDFFARLLSEAAERLEDMPELYEQLRWLAAELADNQGDHEFISGETHLSPEQREVVIGAYNEIELALGLPPAPSRPKVVEGPPEKNGAVRRPIVSATAAKCFPEPREPAHKD